MSDPVVKADREDRRVYKLLIGCTGSCASMKVPELVSAFTTSAQSRNVELHVRVAATEKALRFFRREELPPNSLYTDEDEWRWRERTDPIHHIELTRWADVLLLAPLDANTLAKLAGGLCDNLLTCIARAWPVYRTDSGVKLAKPVLFAPAMNTMMYEHMLTGQHIRILTESFGYTLIPTVTKRLLCGEVGDGALANIETILKATFSALLGTNAHCLDVPHC